jgi:small-conductance mechanosensitive channel
MMMMMDLSNQNGCIDMTPWLQMFENALWLFTSHPFDVGDVIKFKGDRYDVQSIKLQRILLCRGDGAAIIMPTEQMRTEMIHNLTR